MTNIGNSVFSGCISLTKIKIPDSVTSIGAFAFYNCDSLTELKMPNNIQFIGSDNFYHYGLDRSQYLIIYTKSNNVSHKYCEKNGHCYITDDIAPTVTFSQNGSNTATEKYDVKVNVVDNDEYVGIDENSLKYQWTQSTTEPSKASFTQTFENGGTVSISNAEGEYYLWILASDNVGNEIIIRSEKFVLEKAEENPGEENPGEENPGEENPGEENPGEENPGEENPGEENPDDEKDPETGEENPENDNKDPDDNSGQNDDNGDNGNNQNPGGSSNGSGSGSGTGYQIGSSNSNGSNGSGTGGSASIAADGSKVNSGEEDITPDSLPYTGVISFAMVGIAILGVCSGILYYKYKNIC